MSINATTMEMENLTTVIREEFDRLIEKLESVVQHQQKIIDDHEMRIRNVEKYLLGGIGAYSVLITAFTVWKEFFK